LAENFVDFKLIKEHTSIEAVLGRYNVQLRKVNKHSLRGKCPLPTHSSKESSESFCVQLEKKIWSCQSDSCVKARSGKKGGNVLDLVAVMESCSIRDAALKLRDWSAVPTSPARSSTAEEGSAPRPQLASEKTDASDVVNKPLSFKLKDVAPTHAYLRHRGIKEETSREFEVGFFPGRGSMQGRVVIPIHNERGELVAYAGRAIDTTEPKYKFPAGFVKSAVLWNLDRALTKTSQQGSEVIIVEGFFDCMKISQAGFPCVVALMGCTLSDAQEKLLAQFERVVLFLDGDEAGREASATIAARLVLSHFVRVVSLPRDKQPDQLSSDEIKTVLGSL
jgi:DNA primase